MATTTCKSDLEAEKNKNDKTSPGGSLSGDGRESGRAAHQGNMSSSWAEDSTVIPSINNKDEFPDLSGSSNVTQTKETLNFKKIPDH